ncbi:MAG: hypothetical protein JSU00_09650 [Acidobacteria bacterium]|nr:hypothetical protein [Acidobacteriota bacterium]
MALIVPEFYIGVDFAEKVDYTAIAIVEFRAAGAPHFLTPWDKPRPFYGLRHLERLPFGTSYPRAVERVARMTRIPEMERRCTLVVDAGGPGNPLIGMLREEDLDCHMIPVTTTGGQQETQRTDGRTVPKAKLIGTLQLMLELGELRISTRLPSRGRLLDELMNLRAGRSRTGKETFGAAGSSQHDDLVIAVALACWAARKGMVGHVSEGRIV